MFPLNHWETLGWVLQIEMLPLEERVSCIRGRLLPPKESISASRMDLQDQACYLQTVVFLPPTQKVFNSAHKGLLHQKLLYSEILLSNRDRKGVSDYKETASACLQWKLAAHSPDWLVTVQSHHPHPSAYWFYNPINTDLVLLDVKLSKKLNRARRYTEHSLTKSKTPTWNFGKEAKWAIKSVLATKWNRTPTSVNPDEFYLSILLKD